MTARAWRGPDPAWVDGATRILVDCRYTRIDRHDGISRYTERLVTELGRRHPVVMLVSDERQLAMLPSLAWTMGPSPTSLLEPLIAPRAINRLEPDVVFTPMQTMGPLLRRYRLVTTVHDLIYYAHPTPPRDLPAVVRGVWRLYHTTYAFQRFLLNLADEHVTISETTRDLMVRHRMTRRPIHVLRNGVDQPAVAPVRTPPTGRDVLYMGSFMPYKNVETLAAAMRELPGWRLRVLSRASEADRRRLAAAAGDGTIEFLGGVSDDEYAAALASARVLASASRDEGFGLPIVEAMIAGTPVAIADTPIFHEVAGDAAEYFDPDSAAAAAAAIAALDDDALWSRRSADGIARARRYDWSTSGAGLLAVLIEAAMRPRRTR